MLRVGLTGGIGSGKSTVAGRLAEHGAVVIDADAIAREIVEPGTEGLSALVAEFGTGVLADGSLDRPGLARLAFADEQSRQRLNAITHPRIGARTAELMARAAPEAIVVHDIPLLVEGGLTAIYHLVAVVDAPVASRVSRLGRRGLDEADARARIGAQATEAQRREAADVWLDNAETPDVLLAEVDKLWSDRLVPFEAHLRLRMPRPPAPARIAEYDPTWPTQAERIMARVRPAAAGKAIRLDHIGSTAVPSLAAKDVIDLQLTVASLQVADSLAVPLADAGFPRIERIDRDDPQPIDPDPEHWRKRLHVSADPGRAVNLHLRVADWPAQRLALLFRDWLRAHGEARQEYQQLKRALAATHAADDSVEGYAVGKQPWINAALVRAEEWARRAGS
ncbi:MAG: dephospho-CoA kinase [Sciscionella sp.]